MMLVYLILNNLFNFKLSQQYLGATVTVSIFYLSLCIDEILVKTPIRILNKNNRCLSWNFMGVCIFSVFVLFFQNHWINTYEYLLSEDKISILELYVFISMYLSTFLLNHCLFFPLFIIPQKKDVIKTRIQQKF